MAYDDKFGYHELLHTAHIMTCNWDDFIIGHGLMDTDAELSREAERLGREIANFYQKVGCSIDIKFGE